MKHGLKISVRKRPSGNGIAFCRQINTRERFLRWLLGDKARLTLVIPGDSVESVAIQELPEGGETDELS